MTKANITIIIFLLTSLESFGQNDQLGYAKISENIRAELLRDKGLIQYADSINKIGLIGNLSNDVFKIAATLDKQHPAGFFQKAGTYLALLQPNEASFLFYIGYLRYKYYNSANAEYQIGNDGALLASLMAGLREPLTLYLRSNIDNYIEILKKSSDWHSNNDFNFFSRNKNPEMYLDQTNKMKSLISDLETNKSKRQLEWATERTRYLENLESTLAEVDKKVPINKKKKPQTGPNRMIQQEMTYLNSDSLMICGQKIKAPQNCQTVMPGMVTCNSFGMIWKYEPVKEIERHRKEGLAQLKDPLKFDGYVLGTKVKAYQAKFDTASVQIQAYGIVNGQGLLLSIYLLNKNKISTDSDIPEFIRQVFRLNKN